MTTKLTFLLLFISLALKAQTNTGMALPQDTISFNKYLYNHTRYPIDLLHEKIAGVVIATFNVDTGGGINDIKILRNPNEKFSTAVITVLQSIHASCYKNSQLTYAVAFYFESSVQDEEISADKRGVKEMLAKLTSQHIVILNKVNIHGFFYSG